MINWKTIIFNDYVFNFDDVMPLNISNEEKKRICGKYEYYIMLLPFSEKISGIIILGIDKETMQNSYSSFEMLFNGNNVKICN